MRAAGARVVVFPELSLTGYELDAHAVAVDDIALAPLVEACAATDALALVGAPVQDENGRAFIATLRPAFRSWEAILDTDIAITAVQSREGASESPKLLDTRSRRVRTADQPRRREAANTRGRATCGPLLCVVSRVRP